MNPPDKSWELYLGSAVIFGVGVLTGVLYRRFSGVTTRTSTSVTFDTVARGARLAAIRAKNLGRNHKMVFVVRNDLQMGKGKIAAQCSHAAVMCYQNALIADQENLDLWEATGTTKVCVKCDGGEAELKELQQKAKGLGIVSALVRDAGYTQVN